MLPLPSPRPGSRICAGSFRKIALRVSLHHDQEPVAHPHSLLGVEGAQGTALAAVLHRGYGRDAGAPTALTSSRERILIALGIVWLYRRREVGTGQPSVRSALSGGRPVQQTGLGRGH